MSRRVLLALAVGGAGALWVIFRADWLALLQFQIGLGERIFFWGCLAHAVYTPMVRRLHRGEPVLVFTFGVLAAGAVLLCWIGWSDLLATDWANLPVIVWITLAVCRDHGHIGDLCFDAICFVAAAACESDGLHVSHAQLGLGLGDRAGPCTVPPAPILIGVALSVVALVILLKEGPKVQPT